MKRGICDEAGLEAAAAVLLSGGVAIVPTDTVYGLAAHPDFPGAVEKLYSIKGRDRSKPIALLVDSPSALPGDADGAARRLAAKCWPGALTIVLESTGEGCRAPDHEWLRRLIARCGGALRTTSANISGREAPATLGDALAQLGELADAAIDGGRCAGGIASAVVRVRRDGSIEVLREGGDASVAAAIAEEAAQ